MFSYFFFRDYAYVIDDLFFLFLFFLEFAVCISVISFKCVYLSPQLLLILEKTVLEIFLPVIHTDVVALHYLENSC